MATQAPGMNDPDLGMGRALLAHEQRDRLMMTLRVGVIWFMLLAIVTVGLLVVQFDLLYVLSHFNVVLTGLGYTLLVSFASVALASILAFLGALGRLSRNSIANGMAGFYVSLVRGTPLLIQVYIIYFALPRIGTYLNAHDLRFFGQFFILPAIPSGILALGVNYGAYMTEIFRAGIQSTAHGQWEAAQSIGMTSWQTMRRVILPQAVRIIIPDIGNQFIAMQKDSSLVSFLGVWEMTYLAREYGKNDSKFLEMLLVAALVYWALTIISSYLQQRLERSMAHAYER